MTDQQIVTLESENSIEDLIADGQTKNQVSLEDILQAIHCLETRLILTNNRINDLDRDIHKAMYRSGNNDYRGGFDSQSYVQNQRYRSRNNSRTNPNPRPTSEKPIVSNASFRVVPEVTEIKEESPKERFRRAVLRLSVVQKIKERNRRKSMGKTENKPVFVDTEPTNSVSNEHSTLTQSDQIVSTRPKSSLASNNPASAVYLHEDGVEDAPLVFLPDSSFRIAWDCAYMAIVSWEVMLWSLVVFSTEGEHPSVGSSNTLFIVRILTSFFWVLDLVVQMKTAKLKGWEIIEEEQTLRKEFMNGWMWFDGFVSIPFDIIFQLCGEKMLSYHVMSVRVLRLLRIPYLFGHSTPTRETSRTIESMHFSFWLLIIMHLCSCIWIRTATLDEQAVTQEEAADLYTVYSKSFYFIFTTLSSVGYGDISPQTNSMRAYNIFLQWLGLAAIMLVSGRTGAYFITTDPYKLAQLDRKRRLEHLMTNANVPWALQKEAFTIYPSLLDASTKDYQSMLLELPDFIQVKISNHIKHNLISCVPMFRGISNKVLVHLADVLEEVYHGSKEYLIRAGDVGEEMYFLNHGMVEVLLPCSDDPSKELWAATLKSGSWFGEIALLRRTTRIASIRSITSCVLFKLNTVDFDKVVRNSEELRTRLQEETDKRVRQNDEVKSENKPRTADEDSSLRVGVVGSIAVDRKPQRTDPKELFGDMVSRMKISANDENNSIRTLSPTHSISSKNSSHLESPRSGGGRASNPLVSSSKKVWAVSSSSVKE